MSDETAPANPFPHNNICGDCAKARGATWEEGHTAGVFEDVCPYCGTRQMLFHVCDFLWPKGVRP